MLIIKEGEYLNKKELVVNSLIRHAKVRDNDDLLIGRVVRELEPDLETMTAKELLVNLEKGVYGKFESLTRARRKAQEKRVDLRGKKWDERHQLQGKVIKEINDFGRELDELD